MEEDDIISNHSSNNDADETQPTVLVDPTNAAWLEDAQIQSNENDSLELKVEIKESCLLFPLNQLLVCQWNYDELRLRIFNIFNSKYTVYEVPFESIEMSTRPSVNLAGTLLAFVWSGTLTVVDLLRNKNFPTDSSHFPGLWPSNPTHLSWASEYELVVVSPEKGIEMYTFEKNRKDLQTPFKHSMPREGDDIFGEVLAIDEYRILRRWGEKKWVVQGCLTGRALDQGAIPTFKKDSKVKFHVITNGIILLWAGNAYCKLEWENSNYVMKEDIKVISSDESFQTKILAVSNNLVVTAEGYFIELSEARVLFKVPFVDAALITQHRVLFSVGGQLFRWRREKTNESTPLALKNKGAVVKRIGKSIRWINGSYICHSPTPISERIIYYPWSGRTPNKEILLPRPTGFMDPDYAFSGNHVGIIYKHIRTGEKSKVITADLTSNSIQTFQLPAKFEPTSILPCSCVNIPYYLLSSDSNHKLLNPFSGKFDWDVQIEDTPVAFLCDGKIHEFSCIVFKDRVQLFFLNQADKRMEDLPEGHEVKHACVIPSKFYQGGRKFPPLLVFACSNTLQFWEVHTGQFRLFATIPFPEQESHHKLKFASGLKSIVVSFGQIIVRMTNDGIHSLFQYWKLAIDKIQEVEVFSAAEPMVVTMERGEQSNIFKMWRNSTTNNDEYQQVGIHLGSRFSHLSFDRIVDVENVDTDKESIHCISFFQPISLEKLSSFKCSFPLTPSNSALCHSVDSSTFHKDDGDSQQYLIDSVFDHNDQFVLPTTTNEKEDPFEFLHATDEESFRKKLYCLTRLFTNPTYSKRLVSLASSQCAMYMIRRFPDTWKQFLEFVQFQIQTNLDSPQYDNLVQGYTLSNIKLIPTNWLNLKTMTKSIEKEFTDVSKSTAVGVIEAPTESKEETEWIGDGSTIPTHTFVHPFSAYLGKSALKGKRPFEELADLVAEPSHWNQFLFRSLISYKWNSGKWVFLALFLIHFINFMFFLASTIGNPNTSEIYEDWAYGCDIVVLFFNSLELVLELTQVIWSWSRPKPKNKKQKGKYIKSYFQDWYNYLDWLLIFFVYISVSMRVSQHPNQIYWACFAALLHWTKFGSRFRILSELGQFYRIFIEIIPRLVGFMITIFLCISAFAHAYFVLFLYRSNSWALGWMEQWTNLMSGWSVPVQGVWVDEVLAQFLSSILIVLFTICVCIILLNLLIAHINSIYSEVVSGTDPHVGVIASVLTSEVEPILFIWESLKSKLFQSIFFKFLGKQIPNETKHPKYLLYIVPKFAVEQYKQELKENWFYIHQQQGKQTKKQQIVKPTLVEQKNNARDFWW